MTCAEAAHARAELKSQFPRGAIVTLNSGGVLMTVTENSDCCFVGVALSDHGQLLREEFAPECLRIATKDELEFAARASDVPF